MVLQNNFEDFYSRFDGQKSKQSSLVILSEKISSLNLYVYFRCR